MCISPISRPLGNQGWGGINPETASTLRSRLRCVNYRLTGRGITPEPVKEIMLARLSGNE
jgi:hypothetical protein